MIWLTVAWLVLNVAQYIGFKALTSRKHYAAAFWLAMIAVAVDVAYIAFVVTELGTHG